ncbi:hypothetical protein L596_005871 [Steinernema carpocapsae]|uniref:Uncharacterized protein n=1 Tax=Steinernema carpocapsae TaxID=34508 RepID=A0A4U8V522_STECR|nr:hypothetical protein L596_005871 [Steinernema carpocapsae]
MCAHLFTFRIFRSPSLSHPVAAPLIRACAPCPESHSKGGFTYFPDSHLCSLFYSSLYPISLSTTLESF